MSLLWLAQIILTTTAAPAPAPDSVTEHFARARPGTVPRIPASLFLQADSPRDEVTARVTADPQLRVSL